MDTNMGNGAPRDTTELTLQMVNNSRRNSEFVLRSTRLCLTDGKYKGRFPRWDIRTAVKIHLKTLMGDQLRLSELEDRDFGPYVPDPKSPIDLHHPGNSIGPVME